MKVLKKRILKVLMLVICLATIGCSKNNDIVKNKKTIIDMAGDEVEITNDVKTVISLIPYGGQFLVGLGLSDYILAVSDDNVESKWWEVVCPNFDKIKIINEEESAESLLNLNPDIVLVANPIQARELRTKGICAVTFQYYSLDEMKKCLYLLSDIIGEKVKNKVDDYIAYLDEKIRNVKTNFENNSIEEQSVYYINGITYKGLYKTIGKGSTNSALAQLSHVKFVTDDLIEVPTNYVDQEAVLSTNPQNVIIGGRYQHKLYNEIYSKEEWKNIDAIKNKRVYKVPIGISAWNRYGLELALMIPWTAKVVYGDAIDFDVVEEVKQFYKRFVNYEMNNDEAYNIINGLMPNGKAEVEE